MNPENQTAERSPSGAATCSPPKIPSAERHDGRTWMANDHDDTMLVLADYADHVEAERDEWKSSLLKIHPTGRGTPDEIARDIIEGIEAAKVAIALLSENA